MIDFHCNLSAAGTALPHFWEHTVGSDHAPEPLDAHIQRIDAEHANPNALWQKMGQTEYLTEKEVEQLQEASLLWKEPQAWSYKDSSVFLKTDLPPHAVAAITIEFSPEGK